MIVLIETFNTLFFYHRDLPTTKLMLVSVLGSLVILLFVIHKYKFHSITVKADAANSSYTLNNFFAFS